MEVSRKSSASLLLLVLLTLLAFDVCRGRRRSDDINMLQPVVERLSQEMAEVQATLKTMQSRLDDAQTIIGFYVRMKTTSVSGLAVHETIKFNDIRFNAGNSYNVNTGLFTAPLPGTYVIFVEVMGVGTADPYIFLHIMKNGQPLGGAHAGHSPWDNGSNMALVHLNKGDNVYVEVAGGDALNGGEYTTFSGFRLSPN